MAGEITPTQNTDPMALINEQRRLNQENFAQNMAMMRVQQEQHQQQEAIAQLSNTLKNAHDSKMLVLNNAKG